MNSIADSGLKTTHSARYIYLLIFIYHFNFSASRSCKKLLGLRDEMPYILLRVFRHFTKTTYPSTEQTKEGLKYSTSTWRQQVIRNVLTYLSATLCDIPEDCNLSHTCVLYQCTNYILFGLWQTSGVVGGIAGKRGHSQVGMCISRRG
jgi:hypothetical protein